MQIIDLTTSVNVVCWKMKMMSNDCDHTVTATSTGTQDGLANPSQGACLHRNMKVTIKVCCATTTTESKLCPYDIIRSEDVNALCDVCTQHACT